MPDLSNISTAQSIKIIGSDSAGLEQTPVSSSLTGELLAADISNNGGVQGAISVTSVAVEAKVGEQPLSNRKTLSVYNNGETLYWGYTDSVTTLTGTPLLKDAFVSWRVGPNTSVYLIATSGVQNVRITESA